MENSLKIKLLLACIALGMLMTSCATSSRFSFQKKGEVFSIRVIEDTSFMQMNNLLAKNERKLNVSRGGIIIPIFGSAVSYATNGIKNMISRERSKYSSAYAANKNELYFYNTLSFTDHLDPEGIIFKGIECCRTVLIHGKRDTAMYAVFHIARGKAEEMVNNSTFRMVLDSIYVKYAGAKIAAGSWYMPWTYFTRKNPKFDMDVEIRFNASWVTENTQIFTDMPLGSFLLQLRDIPLGKDIATQQSYFKALHGKEIAGKCFIVPRSYGHVNNGSEIQACYGQGLYNVSVNVRETSKAKYVKINDNSSDKMIGILQQYLMNKSMQYLPGW